MRRVTAIKPKGRTQRWTVFVDGKPFAVVDADLRVKHSLHADEPISDETCTQLKADAARLAAWDRASRMLATRGRAAKDLERRLVEKGTKGSDAREAVERLSRTGLVDDARFAATYARQKAWAGHGPRRIAMELSRQGVESSSIRSAVDEALADPSVDAADRLLTIAERRWKGLAKLDELTRKRRLTAFLARRGHGMDAIRTVLTRLGSKGADE